MRISPEAGPRVYPSTEYESYAAELSDPSVERHHMQEVDEWYAYLEQLDLPSERNPAEETPELFAYFKAIQEWNDTISPVIAGLRAKRESREGSLQEAIKDKLVSDGEIAIMRRWIADDLARGILRLVAEKFSDTPGRLRYYNVTVDEGNIIGTLVRGRHGADYSDDSEKPRPRTQWTTLHPNPTLHPPRFQ